MTTTTLFFVILGAVAVAANLMKLVEWLDTPHETPRRVRRSVAAANGNVIELPRAELELESARFAA